MTPPVVTISASYGCGGRLVAAEVARRLGLALVDQVLPGAVAAEVAEAAVEAVEDDLGRGLSHWVALFGPAGVAWNGLPEPDEAWHLDQAAYKRHVAGVFRREAARGAVLVGRGAAVVLRGHPDAVHVRLDGPADRRLAQAMDLGGLDRRTAQRNLHRSDLARQRYVHRLYHADVADPRHYHLVLDATVVPLAACVAAVVAAVDTCVELRRLLDRDAAGGR